MKEARTIKQEQDTIPPVPARKPRRERTSRKTRESAAPAEARKKLPEDVYDELPPEVQFEVTDKAIDVARDVFQGLDNYVVFASTAKYLQGKDKGHEDWSDEPPGDLDISVGDLDELQRVQERLVNVPGVKFFGSSEVHKMPGEDVYRLAGTIPITIERNGQKESVPYKFEVFCQSRIVNKDISRHKEKLRGINVLNIEGLERQLMSNIAFESKIKREVDKVKEYLNDPEVRKDIVDSKGKISNSDVTIEAMQQFDLTKVKLKRFYKLMSDYTEEKLQDPEQREAFEKEVSTLLAGPALKVKLAKRYRDLEDIREA